MRRILVFIGIFLSVLSGKTFASELPFTDIKPTDTYYNAVNELYKNGVISDDGSHLFRPLDSMSRDFYVSLSVAVGCKKCNTPSPEDVMKYQSSPFVDLAKENPYYYCIAYAQESNISQWYPIDNTGKAYCENWSSYTLPPFCAENKISRIEWVAILLRRAGLWNDILNAANTNTTPAISDVTPYWYGYARKGIESWLITQNPDGTIHPDEKVTRWEFAIMAAKTLAYTQCNLLGNSSSLESSISAIDSWGKPIFKTSFESPSSFSLVANTSTWNWNYTWTAMNPITGEQVTGSGKVFPWSNIPEWTWNITLDIIDPTSGKTVSTSTSVISVGNENAAYQGGILISDKSGNPVNGNIFWAGDTITLSPKNGTQNLEYSWEIQNDTTWLTKHGSWANYDASNLWVGDWTIRLITRDPATGKITTSVRHIHISNSDQNNTISWVLPTVSIRANPLSNNLWEGITFTGIVNNPNNHQIQYSWDFWDGSTSNSWSTLSHKFNSPWTYGVTLTILDKTTGLSSQARVTIQISGDRDTDGDGIIDMNDTCPSVSGNWDRKWCPTVQTWNQDASTSILSKVANNVCLNGKRDSYGVLVGSPVCNICPCQNTANILSPVRSCDVLFPTILSPDKTKVYSRWWFYIVP